MAIPAVLHQCFGWADPTAETHTLPAEFNANRLSWMQAYSQMALSFKLWTPRVFEDEVLQNLGAYLGGELAELWLAAYNSPGHWVRQVDLARVLIVYCQGGLYTDLDVAVRPTSPNVATMMRDILASGLFLSSWPRHPEDADAHFEEEVGCEADVLAACKGDARLLDLAQRQVRNVLAARAGPFEKKQIIYQTGPGVFTSWAKDLGLHVSDVASRYCWSRQPGHKTKWNCIHAVAGATLCVYHAGSW